VNLTFKAGEYTLFCNPLNAATNKYSALFASAPNSTRIFKWSASTTPQAFKISTKVGPVWSGDGDLELKPGEGAFIQVPGTTDLTVTFVGEVMQGDTLTVPLYPGFNLVASMVPIEGKVATDLKFPIKGNDKIYKFSGANGGTYDIKTYLAIGAGTWSPGGVEPVMKVGEGFFASVAAAANWTRSFSVNQ
jgi:hypothetical protein